MTDDIFDEIAGHESGRQAKAVDLRRLVELGEEYVALEEMKSRIEGELKEVNSKIYEMKHQTLPDAMNDVGTDHVGASGVDLVLAPYYKANISAEWDPGRQDRGFRHLEEIGGGDVIRTTLTVKAGKDSLEKMRHLMDRIRQMLAQVDLDATLELGKSVPWNSLTSFVKNHVEGGGSVDREALGATIGEVVKIKKRK